MLFIEKGMRRGISQCCNRYDEVNNKYMGSDFKPNDPVFYLMYNDVNNLYGYVMGHHLPYGDFQWVTNHNEFDINTSDDSSYGYILKVDLEYRMKCCDY